MVNCNFCGKPATRNFQKIWVEYKLYKSGLYSRKPKIRGMDIEEPCGEDNVHTCNKCGDKWEEGEL